MTLPEADVLALFASALERAQAGMRQLAGLLEEETLAIESRDLAALERRLDAKAPLLAEIEGAIGEMKGRLEAAGFGFDPEGVAAFFRRHDPEGRWSERWSELLAETRRCERLNREAARLVEREQRRIASALSILIGEDNSAAAYDPQGRLIPGAQRGRTLDQA